MDNEKKGTKSPPERRYHKPQGTIEVRLSATQTDECELWHIHQHFRYGWIMDL